MDVTALLNSSSAALQRSDSIESSTPSATGGTTAASTAVPTPSPERTHSRRTSGSRSPNRNRTPWDAGGYSLPLTLDTKSIHTPSTARPAFYSESPTDGQTSDSPKSPKHKFSDSRSTISSYTSSSSNNSVSHSRISSLSTVSEFQPLANLITDISLDGRMLQKRLESDSLSFPSVYNPQPSSPGARDSGSNDGEISPTGRLPSGRPGSPSDAVIIRRGYASQVTSGSPTEVRTSHISSFLSPNLHLSPDQSPSRAHKRAVSAPDFQPLTATTALLPPFAPTAALNTEPSHQLQSRHPRIGVMDPVTPARPKDEDIHPKDEGPHPKEEEASLPEDGDAEADEAQEDHTIQCMYVPNCGTGSQLRKVVSHLLGRNKLCTRSIPEHVWVHYCRKHYQRARYRNAAEYSWQQCDLVCTQAEQVQRWSDSNRRAGRSGVVQDWSLTVRKREAQRLEENKARKKRRYRDEEDDDEESYEDRAISQGTAVPQWLLDKVNTGYTTEQVIDIIKQIKREMQSGRLAAIPDIEVLPNILTEGDKEKAKPSKNSKSHKRSQSMGASLRSSSSRSSDSQTLPRRVSQPDVNSYYDDTYDHSSPAEKRQRRGEQDYYGGERRAMVPRGVDRGLPGARPRFQLPHRPREPNIEEERYYDRQVFSSGTASIGYSDRQLPFSSASSLGYSDRQLPVATGSYGYSAPLPHGPLPAPTTQAEGPQKSEFPRPSHHPLPPRPTHQRSQSDYASFSETSQTYPSSSAGYNNYGGSSGTGYSSTPAPSSAYGMAASAASGFGTGATTPSWGYSSALSGPPGFPSLVQPSSSSSYGSVAYPSSQSMDTTSMYMPPTVRSNSYQGMSNSYYDSYRSHQSQAYPMTSSYYQPNGAPTTSGAYGGAAKHIRHQSTPVPSARNPYEMRPTSSGQGAVPTPPVFQTQYQAPNQSFQQHSQSYLAPSHDNGNSAARSDELKVAPPDGYSQRH